MHLNNNDSACVVQEIKLAFGDNQYPGDLNLVKDLANNDSECNEIESFFKGKKWYE